MEKLKQHFAKIRVPRGGDRVYKDECMFSFDTPESETGLYICLNSFMGWSKEHVIRYSQRTGNCVFLHLKRVKKMLPPEKEMEPEKKIARLAIGMEGGFNPDVNKRKYEYEETNSVVILPDFDVLPLPNPELPEIVLQSVDGIVKAESALHLAEVEAAAGAWDGEVRQISKYADNLQQLDNGVKVPPNGWKCEECDKTDNLWLNLTDGQILCGRRQLDGSGGNNHAVDHYAKTKYPLAVKLGTITQDGNADVYSYEEDDMVLDPNLVKHLAHFGINVKVMEKTEKTMLELEIDYNQRAWEWSRLTESGNKLIPKFGPGFTGLKNLGNSCYINSVMQVLFTIPSFVSRYYENGRSFMENYSGSNSAEDINIQMAKLGHGLLSGRYSVPPASTSSEGEDVDDLQPGISPLMFRTLIGKGHAEFSTKKQQDAMEFLEHVLKLCSCSSAGAVDPGSCFKFEVEDKFVCSVSGKVRYVTRPDQYLPLPVPMEEAINKEEVAAYEARKAEAQASGKVIQPEEQVKAKIPFDVCLSKLAAPEDIIAFSSAAGKEVGMQKITRLRTFPDYLFIQLVKFGIGQDWVPMKYDVSINMPDTLDLTVLKGFGLQPGEVELPETAPSPPKEPEINTAVVQQLTEMGFPWEACKKAVHLTGNTGSEAAMNWIMEHMGDPDFAEPLVLQNKPSGSDNFTPNEDGVGMLMSMGFTREQASLALKETSNNLERAADWIFSHQHELDALVASMSGASVVPPPQKPTYTDGNPKYELAAFISHMGTSIFVGHYVCHIKKDGEWTIFNDNKVSKSVNPPLDLGYIYLYKRVSN